MLCMMTGCVSSFCVCSLWSVQLFLFCMGSIFGGIEMMRLVLFRRTISTLRCLQRTQEVERLRLCDLHYECRIDEEDVVLMDTDRESCMCYCTWFIVRSVVCDLCDVWMDVFPNWFPGCVSELISCISANICVTMYAMRGVLLLSAYVWICASSVCACLCLCLFFVACLSERLYSAWNPFAVARQLCRVFRWTTLTLRCLHHRPLSTCVCEICVMSVAVARFCCFGGD